ncbi:MAG: nucleoside hydrolase [Myxococcota bacterium]
MTTRVWIDTDIGSDVDDALALAYALRHPKLEVVGVSTVFGDVDLRTRITEALLGLAGGGKPPPPVVTGLGKPLSPERKGVMFGHEGRGLLADAKPRPRTLRDPDPEARVRELGAGLAEARPDALVAIGPLTNLGALLEAGVSLPPLSIMGGKVAPGKIAGAPEGIEEWNWFSDPRAAQTVLAAGHVEIPRVVPAEVTFRTALAPGDVERLAEGDPLARALARLCEEWLVFLGERLGAQRPRVALHDPLTVATLVDDSLCPFSPQRLRVDERGVTHCESGAPNTQVATDVQVDRLRVDLMETWL